jgi:hypothetical protein
MKFYFNLLLFVLINVCGSNYFFKLKGGFFGKINFGKMFENKELFQTNKKTDLFKENKIINLIKNVKLISKFQIFNQKIFNTNYQLKTRIINEAKNQQRNFKEYAIKTIRTFKFFIINEYYPLIKSLMNKIIKNNKKIDDELILLFGENLSNKEDIKSKLIEIKNENNKNKRKLSLFIYFYWICLGIYWLKIKEEEKKRINDLSLYLKTFITYYNLKYDDVKAINTFCHELGHAIMCIFLYVNLDENIKERLNFIKKKKEEGIEKRKKDKEVMEKIFDMSFNDFSDYTNLIFYNDIILNYYNNIYELLNDIDNYKNVTKSYFLKKKIDSIFYYRGGYFRHAEFENLTNYIKVCLAGAAVEKIIAIESSGKIIQAMNSDIKRTISVVKDFFIEKIGTTNKTFFDILKQEKKDEFVKNINEAQGKSKTIKKDEFLNLLKEDVIAKIIADSDLNKFEKEEKEKIAEYIGNFIADQMQKQIEKFKQFEIPIKELAAKYGPASIPGGVYWNGIEMTKDFINSCQKNNIKIEVPTYLRESFNFIDAMNRNLIESNLENKKFIESMEKSISLSPVLNSLQQKYLEMTGKKIEKLNKSYYPFNYLINNGQNAFSINAFQKNMYQMYPSSKQRLLDQLKQNNLFLNSQYLNKQNSLKNSTFK